MKSQAVSGPHGARFDVPVGWKVVRSAATVFAAHDSQLVLVSTFPLLKPYSDALFDKVKRELDVRMQTVSKQLKGTITGSGTATVAGIRAHRYTLAAGTQTVEYTFVLKGKREYQLLCRRPASASDSTCKRLLTSFVL